MIIALLIGRDEQERERFQFFLSSVLRILRSLQPDLDLRVYPDLGDVNDIHFAIAWRAPLGIFKTLPNLRCIASLGAGVDHLFADVKLPQNIPIVRVVDPAMSMEITQYVVASVLFRLKRFDHWEESQLQKVWVREPPFHFLDQTVGVMGLGFLGIHAAQNLHNLGVKIIGWSNSPKHLNGIPTYAGMEELKDFLANSHVVVCLLPLTPLTRHILNSQNLSRLPKGAYLINLARGAHVVEADLLAALDSGQLSGARLDVFEEEPLPPQHPFWSHGKIRITPHIAAVTNFATAVPQIFDNFLRVTAGMTPINTVDTSRGY